MPRFQQPAPRKKLDIEHVLLIVVIILVAFLIIKVTGGLTILGGSKEKAVICIITSSSGYQAKVATNPENLADFISNLQSARYSVLTYGDDLNTLTLDIVQERLEKCDLIIITNFKRVSEVLLDALYNYVQNGGKLIIIGDSLSERYLIGVNQTQVGYIENIFGMKFDLKYDEVSGEYEVVTIEDRDPELIVFETDNPIFQNCVPEEGKIRLKGNVKYIAVTDEDIDLLAWIKGNHGSKPAILEKNYGAGKVIIFTYDPLKYTPCILANAISYLVLGSSRGGLLGISVPAKIF